MKTYLLIMAFSLVLSSCAWADDGSAQLYKAHCAACHGDDGKGNTPEGKKLNTPDLFSSHTQGKPDTELAQIITDGKDKMPEFGGKLTKTQITNLVNYIRRFKPTAPAPQMFGAI